MNKLIKLKRGRLWYPPTKSLYAFLDRVKNLNMPKNIAILGCADGNYVVPAVKKGFKVLAIDIDSTALYGGVVRIGNNDINIIGLNKKLWKIGLHKNVKIINSNYLKYKPKKSFAGVIVSEGLHYEANYAYSLEEIITKIKSYVSIGGLIFLEHLHLSKRNSNTDRFLTSSRLAGNFKFPKWKITSNKIKTYLESPNLRNKKRHKIIIGRLHAQRLK